MIKPFQTPIPVAQTLLFNVGKHQMLKEEKGSQIISALYLGTNN